MHVSVVSGEVVLLADERPVRHDVQLVARVEPLLADVAFEAVQVEDSILGLADQVVRVDDHVATVAAGTEPSAKKKKENQYDKNPTKKTT